MNHVAIIGNLCRDPELHTTQTGTNICNITVAVTRNRANAQGIRESDFFPCIMFNKTAEFVCKYFKKGSRIVVSGSLQNRSWEKDGQKHYVTEIIADEVEFGSTKSDGGNSGQASQGYPTQNGGYAQPQPMQQAQPQPMQEQGFSNYENDDLPF